jgi:hypothetical protein
MQPPQGAAPSRTDARPRVELIGSSPPEIRGTHFRSEEQVSVVVSGTNWTGTATADSSGRFTIRLEATALPARGTPVVHAFGSKGSRARTLATPRLT